MPEITYVTDMQVAQFLLLPVELQRFIKLSDKNKYDQIMEILRSEDSEFASKLEREIGVDINV